MKKAFSIILICCFLGCNQNVNLNQIFHNKKYQILFEEFCNEVIQSDYKNGNKIIVFLNEKKSVDEYCVSIRNSVNYDSNDKFGKFKYKGFDIYVNQNVPKSIIELEKYNLNIKLLSDDKEKIISIQEFVEMYICVQKDTMKVMKINFENNKYLNEWQIIN